MTNNVVLTAKISDFRPESTIRRFVPWNQKRKSLTEFVGYGPGQLIVTTRYNEINRRLIEANVRDNFDPAEIAAGQFSTEKNSLKQVQQLE